ncbi:MAG: hypothetical protein IJG86_06040 [Clostridia bacterium]|nr:hypothetical protein [Clostridia bacterium]
MTRFEEELAVRHAKAIQRIAAAQEEHLKTAEKIAGHLNDLSVSLARIADSLRNIEGQIKRM